MIHLRAALACAFIAPALLLAACLPEQVTAPAPVSPPGECAQVEVLPTITELRPAEAKPGGQVTVIASGGYVRDTCGGYHESAREFPVYLDDEPAGSLSCYVNHCEGRLQVPASAASGKHCLGVRKGSCQLELSVAPG